MEWRLLCLRNLHIGSSIEVDLYAHVLKVGMLGSFLQQDIANQSESSGTQSRHKLGVSKGTRPLDMNRNRNYETFDSGMFSTRLNALTLGSASFIPHPEHRLRRGNDTSFG
jgi:hypothetical protein